jgi:hypothetical protein
VGEKPSLLPESEVATYVLLLVHANLYRPLWLRQWARLVNSHFYGTVVQDPIITVKASNFEP